jgi:chitin-binding protein
MPNVPYARRAVLGSLGLAAIGTPLLLSQVADAAVEEPPAAAEQPAAAPARPLAAWSPDPRADGLAMFENLEDDRAESHPDVKHIYVQGDSVRFDMHLRDRDSKDDRQRNEAVGMRQNGRNLEMRNGETWRMSWDLFIPGSLRATSSFTHIHQLKMPGLGSAPIFVMSLRLRGATPTIETRVAHQGVHVGHTDLAPLQDKWIRTEFEYAIGDNGRVRWVLRDGARTVIDVSKSAVDLFMADRVRPKWGIYRSMNGGSNLRDCHLLLRNLSASGG